MNSPSITNAPPGCGVLIVGEAVSGQQTRNSVLQFSSSVNLKLLLKKDLFKKSIIIAGGKGYKGTEW